MQIVTMVSGTDNDAMRELRDIVKNLKTSVIQDDER